MPAPDYADEYAAARASVRSLLTAVDEAAAATVVPACPDWTVHDLCAHLVGVPAALVVRDNPPQGDNQPWVDRQVAERADRSVAELLDEWDAVGPDFEGLMRKLPHAFGGLVYDAVAHEHDLRGALGRPGERDSAGVWASLEVMVPMVERDLAAGGPTLRHDAVAGRRPGVGGRRRRPGGVLDHHAVRADAPAGEPPQPGPDPRRTVGW